ncbi:hypothetical protein, partial [Burkholderia cenocepacia]|uniref:hypothetical protein n=1 Tax=Burkholderia cenocepacia TaxID=95486 RepID=UPI002AB23D99
MSVLLDERNSGRRLGRGPCEPRGCPDVGAGNRSGENGTQASPPRRARPHGRETEAKDENGGRRTAPGATAGRVA